MGGGAKGGKVAGAAGRARKTREKGAARSFVTSLEEMSVRDTREEQKQRVRKAQRGDDEDGSGSEEDDDESDDDDEEGDVHFARAQTAEVEKPKKASGVAAVIAVNNPNKNPSRNKLMKVKDLASQAPVEQKLSRREREALEKEASAARYMKKHLAGETDEAKKDLARLAEVKRRREDADRRRKEEEEAAAEREKNRKKQAKDDDDDEVLDARAIKALKPNVLKDKLKERGLSIQGQKKDLIQRLIDYENERAL